MVTRSTQPALAAIKLAWWRERLEELDDGRIPAEPRLESAAQQLLPRGISGTDLAGLEHGWATCLQPTPDIPSVSEHGSLLFAIACRLIDVPFDEGIGDAGSLFAITQAARRGLITLPSDMSAIASVMPKRARPLTGLAALAARDLRCAGRDFEPEATPGRSWILIRHRVTGRI